MYFIFLYSFLVVVVSVTQPFGPFGTHYVYKNFVIHTYISISMYAYNLLTGNGFPTLRFEPTNEIGSLKSQHVAFELAK